MPSRTTRASTSLKAGWTTPAKAAGRSKPRSTRTSPRRSSPCRCSAAFTRATATPSRGGAWRRCATRLAATPSASTARKPAGALHPPAEQSMALDVSVSTRDGEVIATTQQRPAPPCAVVIFGASGDLTHRKLIPALFDVFQAGLLSKHFAVLGFSRSQLSDDDFRRTAREGLEHYAP